MKRAHSKRAPGRAGVANVTLFPIKLVPYLEQVPYGSAHKLQALQGAIWDAARLADTTPDQTIDLLWALCSAGSSGSHFLPGPGYFNTRLSAIYNPSSPIIPTFSC
ncbi:hypothetical protein DPEC_G00197380 [Dallia pectoralis]|uniref:Uncharacterized protein n=1 Tax=Dallia pectoralis TaxID=75939 RepID=A0ACC2G7U9_DALPE|nr:hypothetical protein DPEC_G00197380 [Dallia pectoralis]